MNIYVGNLPHELTEAELTQTFSAHGNVAKASLIKDKFTGSPRGFGFVEMSNDAEAKAAIAALNGKELKGRPLTVNEARPKEDRPRSNFGGGARRGFGGGERREGGFRRNDR